MIQQVSDRFARMEYVESWGELGNGCYFLIRTPLESIRESVAISNSFISMWDLGLLLSADWWFG